MYNTKYLFSFIVLQICRTTQVWHFASIFQQNKSIWFCISFLTVVYGERTDMEQVFKHYGGAILAVIVILALGGILVTALATNGYVAEAFREAIEGFFASMDALEAGTPPAGA